MKFELSIGDETLTVSLDSLDPNEPASIQYDGDAEKVGVLKDWLSRQFGAFGHSIDPDVETPIDLHYALSTDEAKQWFDAKLIEGGVPSYDPGIPSEAMT